MTPRRSRSGEEKKKGKRVKVTPVEAAFRQRAYDLEGGDELYDGQRVEHGHRGQHGKVAIRAGPERAAPAPSQRR